MAHMIQQIIKYSDGTQTVINYRGVIKDGVLIPNEEIKMSDEEILEGGASSEEVTPSYPEVPVETGEPSGDSAGESTPEAVV